MGFVETMVQIMKKMIKNPGSKGGIGYYNESGQWQYGKKSEGKHELSWSVGSDGKFKTKTLNEAKKDNPDLDEATYKKMYKSAYSDYYKKKNDIDESMKNGGVKDKEVEKPKPKALPTKLDWHASDSNTFKTKTFGEMQKEHPELTQEQYKLMYKKSYTEFYNAKNKGNLSAHKLKTSDDKPKEEPKEKPKNEPKEEPKDEPKKEFNSFEWSITDDGKFKGKTFGELKKEYPDLDKETYQKFYKKSYSEYFKAQQNSSQFQEMKGKPQLTTVDQIKGLKAKKEPKKDDNDEPQFLDHKETFDNTEDLYKKIGQTSQIALVKEKILNDTHNGVKFQQLQDNPQENTNKIVMWQQKDDTGEKWIIGKISEYDPDSNMYVIAGGAKGSFMKVRPIEAIIEPYVPSKKLNPKYKVPETKIEAKDFPAFDNKKAKKYVEDEFSKMVSDKDKVNGVTVLHDSNAIEGTAMKVRLDPVNKEYYVEFKLRDSKMQFDFKSTMQSQTVTGAKEEKVQWENPQNGALYSTQMYKLVSKFDSDTKIEYFNRGVDSAYDSGYALRDTVRIKVKTDKPQEAYEKAINVMNDMGLNKVTTTTTEKDIKKLQNMSLLNQIKPQTADTLSGKLKDTDPDEIINQNDSLMNKHLGADWQDKIKYVETGPGHNSFVVEGMHKVYESVGARFVWQGVSSEEAVVGILKNGSMCSTERHKHGIISGGASCHSDYSTGGAEYVFTRLATNSSKDEGFHGYGSGSYQVTYKKEVMDRTDWFGYETDKYGETNPNQIKGNYAGRRGSIDHINHVNKHFSSANEMMFKKSIKSDYIENILCTSAKAAEEIYKSYKKQNGTTKMDDGRDISEVIAIKGNNQGNHIHKLYKEVM